MNSVEPVIWGLSLAACAGLRVFLPFFFLSVMSRFGNWPMPQMFEWVATDQGFWILAIATLMESLGDKVPIVDHVLDSIQSFIKPIAGLLLPVVMLHDFSPAAGWVLGLVAGAPLALGVHATKATTRVGSTVATAGFGNAFLSLLEDLAAGLMLVITLLAPVLALIAIGFLLFWGARLWRRRRSRHFRMDPTKEPP